MSHIDKTLEVVRQVSETQGQKGIRKYGQALNPLDDYDWLKMALEEKVDDLQYTVAEMIKRKFIADKIRGLASRIGESDENYIDIAQDILFWCDEMDGGKSE